MGEKKQYDNELKGALFVNERRTDPKHPVARGTVQVGGKKYNVSAFARTIQKGPKAGQKFWSLVLQAEGSGAGSDDRAPTSTPPVRDDRPQPTDRRGQRGGHAY